MTPDDIATAQVPVKQARHPRRDGLDSSTGGRMGPYRPLMGFPG